MSAANGLPAPLSKIGRRMLAEAEATIEQGLSTFFEVGKALVTIRDGRLYRDEHESFEHYCRDRWGFSRQRAHQLIEAADVSTMVDIQNERQARALAPLADDPDALREAWDEANRDGKPTAAKLAQAVQKRTTTETSTVTFDPETGEILTSPSGSDQSGGVQPDAAGPGDDQAEPPEASSDATPASPAPKVAPDPVLSYRAAFSSETSRVRNGLFGFDVERCWLTADEPKAVEDFARDLIDYGNRLLAAKPRHLQAVQ